MEFHVSLRRSIISGICLLWGFALSGLSYRSSGGEATEGTAAALRANKMEHEMRADIVYSGL